MVDNLNAIFKNFKNFGAWAEFPYLGIWGPNLEILPQTSIFFGKYQNFGFGRVNTLSMRSRPFSTNLVANWNYAYIYLCFWPQMPKHGNSGPAPQIFRQYWKCRNTRIDTLSTSLQPLSNIVANWNYAYFCVLGHKCPNMVICSRLPNFWNILKIINFKMVALIRFC